MTRDKRGQTWYRDVLDAIPYLILVKGARSKLLWANKAFRDHYGMTNEQLEDIVDAPHSDPDDTVQYVKDDHYVYTTGEILDIPAEPGTDSKGQVAYYHTIKAPIRDAAGRVVSTVGISRRIDDPDVLALSERDRRSRKQQLSELRTMVHHMPLAVAMFDVKQRFLAHSLAWIELFEHRGDVLVGEYFDRHFASCIALAEAMSRAADENAAATLHAAELRTLGGSLRAVDVEIQPWSLPSGETGGTIVLLHDITEMLRTQNERKQLHDELLQFNYRVSHDLLSPLKTVQGFIELCEIGVAEGDLDAVRTYHQIIRENVAGLGALVEDVLDLARADIVDSANSSIDIEQTLQEILGRYAMDIESAGISVTIDCAVKQMTSQRIRVVQVMDNLIGNAVKYHDPDKPERFIEIRAQESDPCGVTLTVRDNGVGFDAALSEQIFDIFKRGNSKRPGSGLGLYIARKHVDYLSGRIRVLSPRDDTVFEVFLPQAAEDGT